MKRYMILCVSLVVLCALGAAVVSQASTAVEVMALQDAPMIFVIDAGHGGEDGGAVSTHGTLESGINLEIATKLNALMAFMGVRTKMIRTTDTAVNSGGDTVAQRKVSDIKNRVAMVEATQNAVLVSIHQNKFPQEKYRGAQVFYSSGNEILAQALQDALRTHLDPKNHRETKLAKDIYLMEHVTCPAVLVECGFLSNPQEELLLRDPQYQKKLACVLACTLQAYAEEANEV